ncbi:DUF4157 domain-containing protein [Dyella tabacisoli]|uniref:DUF4157 domain-containing protein n=2 Tax=Dyella tabacisoli TaxID=2282381 RepID=A0A369ULD2_9GAMM|nr:DUF4157 domain-containing protein [Dyella tabacisoli]
MSAAGLQLSRKCAACDEEHEAIQTKRDGSTAVSGDAPGLVHSVLRSSGQPLDQRSRSFFEPRFRHDFSRVRVHADTNAAASARSVGALAYAVGPHIVFNADRYAPRTATGQALLAHELAHVVQQSHGDGGEHATIRRYTEFDAAAQTAKKSLGWVHPAGSPLRVSDDGNMAAEDNGWGENLSKRAWTTSANLATSNAKLAAVGSKAKLVAKGNPISGIPPASPKSAAITLQEVEPVKAAGGGPLELASDCGSACKQVTGSPSSGKDVSVMKGDKSETYGSPKDYHGGDPTTPEEWTEEVYKKEFGAGLSRQDAYNKYAALSATDKDKFDRKYGRNKYARPEVGQGITISTEKDAPGSHDVSSFTWNFHYAAAVMSSGSDYITLENAAGWATTGWIFFMYGPVSKAQTFLEQQAATLTHGSDPSAVVVESEKALDVATIDKDAPLLVGTKVINLAKGTALRVSAKNVGGGQTWLTVEVKSGPQIGTKGQIRNELVK